jgi:hypothetical protein
MWHIKQPKSAVPRRAGLPVAPLIGLAVCVVVSTTLYWAAPAIVAEARPALDQPACRNIWLVPRTLFGVGAGVAAGFAVAGAIWALRAGQARWFFLGCLFAAPFAFIAEVGRQLLVYVGNPIGC